MNTDFHDCGEKELAGRHDPKCARPGGEAAEHLASLPDPVAPQQFQETQAGVSCWVTETFGPAQSNRRDLLRACQEMHELCVLLGAGCVLNEQALEEIADIFIAMTRGASLWSADIWATLDEEAEYRKNPGSWTLEEFAASIYATMTQFYRTLLFRANLGDCPRRHPHLCERTEQEQWIGQAQILVWLSVGFGGGLRAAIDAKMKVNRARSWKLDGTGCGQHEERDAKS